MCTCTQNTKEAYYRNCDLQGKKVLVLKLASFRFGCTVHAQYTVYLDC